MNPWDDVGDLNRIVADLERRCTYMAREMEKREKGKATVVDKLLLGTRSPFTKRVANEKFKVSQIPSYARTGDSIEHLENFRTHLDLHGTPDEVACRAFPLLFLGVPKTGSGSCPRIPLISSRI